MNGSVKIINYNTNAHSIVSAAGRISTTEGSADEIYKKSQENEDESNIKLIEKILSSGHESVLEHISVNLSFNDVSVFVEQFMIEFRLASFTVKSRRYVDFGKMGYILPDFSKYSGDNRELIENTYKKHMDYLFGEYNHFVQAGVPKEDARFVLPYSFKSNFYCTVNGRELIKIMNEMVNGRGSRFSEIAELGMSLFTQCEDKLPYLSVKKTHFNAGKLILESFGAAGGKKKKKKEKQELVSVISGTDLPEKIICRSAALNYGIDIDDINTDNVGLQTKIISAILKGSRRRELEQTVFTIRFNRISLAGVTHLVRHRMQSIVIPDYTASCDFYEYVLPESIVRAGLKERYDNIFKTSRKAAEELAELGFSAEDGVYLLLSGLTVPIMTTMNGNELYTFIRLRTCSRAQWEIKACADALLSELRSRHPVMFSLFGPSCFVLGQCPEGRMSCGSVEEMFRKYGQADSSDK